MYHLSIRTICFLVIYVLLVPMQASASDKKSRQENRTAAERIESLLEILRNDRKEEHRIQAAEELGKLASNEFPEIVAGLIDALVRDESSSVRKTVIRSLASIKPESHEIKDALEQAVKSDKAWSVRQVARLSVFRYKPKDEPHYVPGPKLRNTSKPSQSGNVQNQKALAPKLNAPVDPLKTLPVPEKLVADHERPEFPLAPVMAPAPGTLNSTVENPARLTAPKPGDK